MDSVRRETGPSVVSSFYSFGGGGKGLLVLLNDAGSNTIHWLERYDSVRTPRTGTHTMRRFGYFLLK
jgi:hypothetical protein